MCTHPISVKSGKSLFSINRVPCGKCFECKKQYQNDWMVRMVEEFRTTPVACFVTLTYNEQSVPWKVDTETGECHRTVCKQHVQNWVKRFRTSQARKGLSTSWRYYCTSEYGPRTFRPHYHLLVWLSRDSLQPALRDWEMTFGFTKCDELNITDPSSIYKVAQYVSKYCSKGMFECPLVSSGQVEPTFHLCSKGLGNTYPDRMRDYHLVNDTKSLFKRTEKQLIYSDDYLQNVTNRMRVNIPGNDCSYHMPRYWKEKIFSKPINDNGKVKYEENQVWLQACLADFLCKRNDEIYRDELAKLQALHPDWSRDQAVCCWYLQKAAELEQREKNAESSLARFYSKSKL